MKTKLTAIILAASLAAVFGADVKYPVTRKEGLTFTGVADSLSGGPTLKVQSLKKSPDEDTYSVTVSGNKLGTSTIEFYFEARSIYSMDFRLISAGQAVVSDPTGEATFSARKLMKESKGWFVRMVNSGTLVAYAGSSPKFEEMAKSPATFIAYGYK